VGSDRYSFTLEMFSQRREAMGRYKGIGLRGVERILKDAKRAGFKEIKLNYIAGIDPIQVFRDGVARLRNAGIFDSVGLSILTAFFIDQLELRHHSAWQLSYYTEVLRLLRLAGVDIYEPTCFEMGFPVEFLQPHLPWMAVRHEFD
jgi:sugar phosphate isomerase/epimerase